jgi:hypothetical protein
MSARSTIRAATDGFSWHIFHDFHAVPNDTVFLELSGAYLRSVVSECDADGRKYLLIGLSPYCAGKLGIIALPDDDIDPALTSNQKGLSNE